MRNNINSYIDSSSVGKWDFERSYNADYGIDSGEDIPFIHNHLELQKLLSPLYIIDDYMDSVEHYDELFHKIENIVRGCFTIQVCREWPVKFKFYRTDKTTHTIELRMLYINLIGWKAFVNLHGIQILDDSYILTAEQIPQLNTFINEKIILPLREYHVKPTVVNYVTSEVCGGYRRIDMDFSQIMNLGFGAETFIDLYQNNDTVQEIMNTGFEDLHQPVEIEERLNKQQDRLIKELTSLKDNPLGVMLRANTGIKHKQLAEFMIAEGLKPTLEGKTIPIPIQTSTIRGGLTTPADMYIDGIGARKSVISNKKVMGKAGYFSKSLTLLNRSLSMSSEIADCHSRHLVMYTIKSKKHLQKLDGKYYKFHPDDDDFFLLNASMDKKLIGKTIYCRSVATCALHGNKVCPRCVGKTANISEDIADGFAAFQTEETTKVLNQNVLSTKHLLTTNSEEILFSEGFDDFFTMSSSEIYPIVNNNERYEDDISRFAIYIDPDDIEKASELDEDSLYNTVLTTGRIYIRDLNKEYEDFLICTVDKDGKPEEREIYITKDASDIMKKYKNLIPFSLLDDDMKLFELVIDNNELTKPLYDIMNLINKDRKNDVMTIDEMCQKLLDLMVDANIGATATSSEMIVNRLIRRPDDIYKRPDFSKKKMPDYVIVTARKALDKNESPYIGLSYQDIKRQVQSDDLYTKRNAESYLDPLFKTEVDMTNLKNYARYADPKNKEKYDAERKARMSHTFYSEEYRKRFHEEYKKYCKK